jgi:hypothetical protein
MKYVDFRDSIQAYLDSHPEGSTWKELRARLRLPYEIPCPAWIHRMEKEAGLSRLNGPRGKVWVLNLRKRS